MLRLIEPPRPECRALSGNDVLHDMPIDIGQTEIAASITDT
jgi:hypothetical protein